MKANEIRAKFLKFFEARGHRVVPSSPVVPQDDPTLLFTNAGMNQFKDTFLGLEKREYARAASSQKCIRAGGKHNDLEQVGHTARHQTFFEMLGNFSFGDYFKSDAIAFAWEFLLKEALLPKERLWITIHTSDDEAAEIWKRVTGFGDDRIVRLGDADNFWQMGDTGPCGPCTEIHFDKGIERACGPSCGLGKCSCERFMEIWNNVFMQFERKANGEMTKLPKPSVDTGMGLERLASILQRVETNFETDLLRPLIDEVARLSGKPYDRGEAGVPHRVIADHVRALTFAFADGALPSNEGRGYVLRRILRRAARYGRKLDLREAFIHRLVPTLVGMMGDAFPEIRERQDHVMRLIKSEEDSFNETLDRGLELFDQAAREVIDGKKGGHSDMFPGPVAFKLYDTYGFPPDLTRILAQERHLGFDETGFEQAMAEQQARSRAASKFERLDLSHHGANLKETRFLGYAGTTGAGAVVSFNAEKGELLLDATPFYAESGGQVGDSGVIEAEDGGWRFRVRDTRKAGGVIVHFGALEAGDAAAVKPGAKAKATADRDRRVRIMKNHTATHLLHWALHQVVGGHAKQAGSVVDPDRLRFDFSNPEAVRPEQIEEIERRVNQAIIENHDVSKYERSLDEAKRAGVTALFGEKYGERVRVVDIAGFSRELCGGT
ncbi:MAG TPA: alanine--tRNA ligase, partial [Planctomycetota bacterium]|nr:alanine--tRNA ligase [Planctomycetota bacterium]